MLDSKLLHTLAAVIECGGFERAALQIGVTQSAVSQRIKQLEALLGQPVLLRSQPLTLTAAGHSLLRHFRQLSLLEQELMQELQPARDDDQAFRSLHIAADPDSLASWLLPALLPLLRQQRLQLHISPLPAVGEPIVQSTPYLSGCISQQADCLPGSQYIELGQMHYRCVCTPTFYERHFAGGPARAPAYSLAVVLHGQHSRHACFLQQQLDYHDPFPYASLPDPAAMLTLIRNGLAYGLLPEDYLQQHPGIALYDIGSRLSLPLYWHYWGAQTVLAEQLSATLRHARQPAADDGQLASQQLA